MKDIWRKTAIAAGLAGLLAAGSALSAMFIQLELENVPIERATANLERMIGEQPGNIGWRINLARIYAMASAQKVPTVKIIKNHKNLEGQPFFGYYTTDYQMFTVVPAKDAAETAAAAEHLKAAIATYRDVLKVAPENSVAALGLGWSLSLAGEKAEAVKVLRQVIEREWPREQKGVSFFPGQKAMVEEAAAYLIPLLDPGRDAAEIATLKKRVATFADAGRMITPIAVPLCAGLTALDITDEHASVLFDADGSGIARRWTWLSPEAAWLVFDRKGTGQITSALQWFGSVTFWMFWDSGYDALRVLDDDGDRMIRGNELRGFALWHDRNQNGVSEKGEVRTLAEHGIVGLSTRYEHDALHPDEIAWSSEGVTFADGEVRPTFDLILRTSHK